MEMENQQGEKRLEVTFVSDQDVETDIISINDRKREKSEKGRGRKPKIDIGSREEIEREEELDEQPFEDNSDTSEKPTELFEVGDIPGHEIFGFQTPKKKNSLSKMIDVSPQSGKINNMVYGKLNCTNGNLNGMTIGKNGTPLGKLNNTSHGKLNGTPLSKKFKKCLQSGEAIGTPRTYSYKITTRTPYSLRKRMKSKIACSAKRIASDSSENDFSEIESDYKPSNSESSSSSAEEDDDSVDEDSKEPEEVQKSKSREQIRHHNMEYVLEAEEFFSNKKSITSNHTLNRLQKPRLAEEQLQKLLENMTLSHQEAVRCLGDKYPHYFEKWIFALREQYSVLLYGLGSKFHTLQQFRKTMLQDHLVLEVNGFFPSLTIKEVVASMADELLDLSYRPSRLLECLETIETDISCELYVIIHNLDGPMLRSDKSQDILSRLVSMQNVHLIASIDHINAPLIWDHAKLSRFHFLWWDVTSFQPYNGETQFETSILVQQSGKLALSSLSNVFHSLTRNARSIFIMMVRHQLEHHKDPVYQGMSFRDLYWSSREAMLVSSDIALRAQLTEFLDHRLVHQHRGHDGSELLQIPIDIAVLQWFIEQVEGGI